MSQSAFRVELSGDVARLRRSELGHTFINWFWAGPAPKVARRHLGAQGGAGDLASARLEAVFHTARARLADIVERHFTKRSVGDVSTNRGDAVVDLDS